MSATCRKTQKEFSSEVPRPNTRQKPGPNSPKAHKIFAAPDHRYLRPGRIWIGELATVRWGRSMPRSGWYGAFNGYRWVVGPYSRQGLCSRGGGVHPDQRHNEMPDRMRPAD